MNHGKCGEVAALGAIIYFGQINNNGAAFGGAPGIVIFCPKSKEIAHRARPDVFESIEELRFYRDHIFAQ